ncbi:MAG: chromate transporter [Paracoccus denitrificans]|nr:MAG: chromate transporter [Paracoccus denitrificans]PZO85928.1 MAG: chromate transporter [Paracoccus denitrificans]
MSDIWQLVREMAPLSLVSFGGGTSIIAQLETIAVRQHGWVTAQQFVHLFAVSRVAPGPGSTLSTLLGWQVAGIGGAIAATIAIYAPSTLLSYAVFRWTNSHRDSRWHRIFRQALAPIGIGLVAAGITALFRMAHSGFLGPAIAICALILVERFPRLSILFLLAMGAAVSLTFSALT